MRISVASLLFVVLVGGAACKSKTAGVDEKTQKDLAARRDILLATRKKLSDDKVKIEAEIKSVEASGGDASGLKKQLSDVTEQQSEMLAGQISELSAKVDGIARAGAGGGGDAQSNAALQAEVTRLEGLITKLEAAMRAGNSGGGEVDTKLLAQMTALSEKCGNSAGPAVVVQAAAPKGANYTRAEVEPLLSRARANMSKKGLMISDLPGQAQGLESEATKAMATADWGRAYLAASQLAGNVDAIKVDRDFVRNKMLRLNARVSSAKLSESANAAMSAGLQEVSDKYTSGDFAAANRKINLMFAAL